MINWKQHKVLLIAPHLDDIELGMGGVLNQMSLFGAEIHYIGLSLPHLVDETVFMEEFWASQRHYQIPKDNYHIFNFNPRDLFSSRSEILQLFYDFNQQLKPTQVYIQRHRHPPVARSGFSRSAQGLQIQLHPWI